jgi:putative membrane protein insertion efficiency factor
MIIKIIKAVLCGVLLVPVNAEEPWSYYLDHQPTSELENFNIYDNANQEKEQGAIGSFLIQVYRDYLSPIDGSRCPYSPTCSRYGQESFKLHGYLTGSFMTADRLIRCHPQQRENRYDPPIIFP